MSPEARSTRRFIPPEYPPIRWLAADSRPTSSNGCAGSSTRHCSPAGFPTGEAVQAPLKDQELEASRELIDPDLLHCEADIPAHVLGVSDDVEARDRSAAGGRPHERPKDADRRRFAGAVRPEDAVHLTLPDSKRDTADGLDAGRVALRKTLDDDRVRASPPVRARASARELGAQELDQAGLLRRLGHRFQRRCGHRLGHVSPYDAGDRERTQPAFAQPRPQLAQDPRLDWYPATPPRLSSSTWQQSSSSSLSCTRPR